jgi:hypothetical protein
MKTACQCENCKKMHALEKKLGPMLHRSKLDPSDIARVLLLYAHVGLALEHGHDRATQEILAIAKQIAGEIDGSALEGHEPLH